MSLTISKLGPLRFNFILRNKKKSQVLKEQRFDMVKYIRAKSQKVNTIYKCRKNFERDTLLNLIYY